MNSTLGSWAEYRYALQLSSREDASWRGGSEQAPGFVEPLPDFFNSLGRATGAGLDPTDFRMIADLRLALDLEKLIVHLQLAEAERSDDSISGNAHYFKVNQSEEMLTRLFPPAPPAGRWDWKEEKDRRTVAGMLRDFTKAYWQGKPEALEKIRKESADLEDDLSPRWAALSSTCFRLEAMAERQLSGKPWRESDIGFLKNYGAHLAWLMFYEGNSYLSPDDDASRIARYATDASPQGTRVHHAAVARPRLLLLHYPDHAGKPVLCQGAVYSFRHVERDRTPTRAEWNSECDKATRPVWMDPITGAPAPSKAK